MLYSGRSCDYDYAHHEIYEAEYREIDENESYGSDWSGENDQEGLEVDQQKERKDFRDSHQVITKYETEEQRYKKVSKEDGIHKLEDEENENKKVEDQRTIAGDQENYQSNLDNEQENAKAEQEDTKKDQEVEKDNVFEVKEDQNNTEEHHIYEEYEQGVIEDDHVDVEADRINAADTQADTEEEQKDDVADQYILLSLPILCVIVVTLVCTVVLCKIARKKTRQEAKMKYSSPDILCNIPGRIFLQYTMMIMLIWQMMMFIVQMM